MKTKVVGVGLGKTGTKTLAACMRTLGFNHLSWSPDPAVEYARGDYHALLQRTEEFDSFDDFPWTYLSEMFDENFENCRFILTVRKDVETWYESLCGHYCRYGPMLARKIFYGYYSPFENPEHHKELYLRHNEEIRGRFKGQSRFLEVCWENGDGWEKLCAFLSKPVPGGEFPKVNSRASKFDYTQAKRQADKKLETLCRRVVPLFRHETQWMLARLVGAEHVEGAEATELLPPRTARIREAFQPFPTESKRLIRPTVVPVELTCPRVALVRVPRLQTLGFRLLRAGSHFFNDHSLVKPEAARADLATKIGRGFTESIPFSGEGPLVTSAPQEVEGPVLVLSSDEPANFGSWLFRILPKYVLARPHVETRRVFVYALQNWMKDILKRIDPEVEIVQHIPKRSYRITDAIVPSIVAQDKYWRPELYEAFAPMIAAARRAHPETPEKVYISRRRQPMARPGMRVMENETELVERLIPRGFVEFAPEAEPFDKQVATIAAAKVIVTPGGSNLFGCYFAEDAELIVDIESSATSLHAHANVLASCGRPYSIVHGVPTERGTGEDHRTWVADVDCLMAGFGRLGVV